MKYKVILQKEVDATSRKQADDLMRSCLDKPSLSYSDVEAVGLLGLSNVYSVSATAIVDSTSGLKAVSSARVNLKDTDIKVGIVATAVN